jgi:Protein of unknown function (DUF1566)
MALAAAPALAAPPAACADGDASLPTTRFRDNGDGTVTDLESKLMWMRCSIGQRSQAASCSGAAGALSWAEAQRRADTVNLDGSAFYNDWRLPSMRELATITARDCAGLSGGRSARTNIAVFPATAPAAYWSATPRPGEGSAARVFALGFGAEGVLVARKDERHHLRLVRTGP